MPQPDDGTVDLSEIARTKVPEPVIDANTRNERDRFAHVEKMQGAQLGWLGRLWGSSSEKAGNIAGFLLIVLVLYLGIMIFYFAESKIFDDVFGTMTSIVTLILGYLFGKRE